MRVKNISGLPLAAWYKYIRYDFPAGFEGEVEDEFAKLLIRAETFRMGRISKTDKDFKKEGE